MKIDEGGVPSGSLTDYFSQKAEEAKKQTAPVAQGQMEQVAQPIAVLRAHLEELDTPLRNLFLRFRVIELLEEVQTKYWIRSKYLGRASCDGIRETSSESNKTTYGLVLTSRYNYPDSRDIYVYIPGGFTHSVLGPDRLESTPGRSIKTGRTKTDWKRVYRKMIIESGTSGSNDSESEYNLRYRYFEDEDFNGDQDGLYIYKEPYNFGRPLIPKTEQIIRADQPLEVLVKLIGDDARRTVSIPGMPKE